MIGRHSRFLSRGSRQGLQWEIACALPLLLSACRSPPPNWPPPHVGQETSFTFLLGSPPRAIDILFVIDNSPSMANKQAALAANIPKMIQILQQLPGPNGGISLPDVHIGVVSSDMGAGNAGRWLGDRGLLWGNDPSPGAIATVGGAGCGLDPGARWIEDVLKLDGSGRSQNYTGVLADVFSCMAQAVGFGGSVYPQPLQALRVAVNPQSGINEANTGFLRSKAYLFIVLISDQDDCSADPDDTKNDGLFLQVNPGDSARLRCAARGHICNGQPIPDYAPATGYTGQGFSADLGACAAKDQVDPAHPDPAYLPLIRVEDVVDSVLGAKAGRANRVLVSGIIGWPTYSDRLDARYAIGKDSAAPSPQNTLWDTLPICTAAATAASEGNGYQAYAGLRLKQFLDTLGHRDTDGNAVPNGFSICDQDFTNAMTQLGSDLIGFFHPGCVYYPLVDSNPSTLAVDPECQAVQQAYCDTNQNDCPSSGYRENPLPQCRTSQGELLDPENPKLDAVPDDNRPCWYLLYDPDPLTGCPMAFRGQTISVLRQAGHVAPPGSRLAMTCWTCPDQDPLCPGPSR